MPALPSPRPSSRACGGDRAVAGPGGPRGLGPRALAVGGLLLLVALAAACGRRDDGGRGHVERAVAPYDLRRVVLSGTPYEMGLQHGRMLGEEIRRAVSVSSAPGLESAVALYAGQVRPLLPAGVAEELRGLAEGAGVGEDALLRAEVALEARRWHQDDAPLVEASFASPPGQEPVVAVAYEGLARAGLAGRLLLVERRPAGGTATLVLSWAGSLGALAGVSSRGVVAAEGDVGGVDRARRSLKGPPFPVALRVALEAASDAKDLVTRVPGLLGNRVIAADRANGRALALAVVAPDPPSFSAEAAWVIAPAGPGGDDRQARQERAMGTYPVRPGPDDAVALALAGCSPGATGLVLRLTPQRIDLVAEPKGTPPGRAPPVTSYDFR